MTTTTPSRDELRTQLLGNMKDKVKTKRLTIFGTDIELRQPTLGAIMEAQALEDPKKQAALMIIRYACIPATTTLIFEEGDEESILEWPYGDDLRKLQGAIVELSGVNIDLATGELRENPLDEGLSNSPES